MPTIQSWQRGRGVRGRARHVLPIGCRAIPSIPLALLVFTLMMKVLQRTAGSSGLRKPWFSSRGSRRVRSVGSSSCACAEAFSCSFSSRGRDDSSALSESFFFPPQKDTMVTATGVAFVHTQKLNLRDIPRIKIHGWVHARGTLGEAPPPCLIRSTT